MTEAPTIETFETTPDAPSPEWLSELLRRHHVTQAQASRWMRVSKRSMVHWIAGTRAMTWAHAELLRRLVREHHKARRCRRRLTLGAIHDQ